MKFLPHPKLTRKKITLKSWGGEIAASGSACDVANASWKSENPRTGADFQPYLPRMARQMASCRLLLYENILVWIGVLQGQESLDANIFCLNN